MLRGVNRRIIEVSDCGSDCFERAIFFIRTDVADKPEAQLKSEADRIISYMSRPPKSRRKKYKISRRALWLITVLSLCCAVAMTFAKFV